MVYFLYMRNYHFPETMPYDSIPSVLKRQKFKRLDAINFGRLLPLALSFSRVFLKN